ncbi:protein transport protein Sec31A isoform X2 [Anthonomus grandis grandis]|uniref:protein transport protein Sec31A isoform X2 n=1 Tax=Anthonomus grandis grandis TaxID=2921223 RepID=UPI002166C160|nr:protein transport protein Sec31A isoform X2 [Anthonomus grandis grandis]
MKVKDIERTANVAWSPKNHHPIYIAAGTAASQLDASFNTNAALEIYSLNLTEPGPDTQLVSSLASEHRFHKLIWGPSGSDSSGTIIAGCDDGLLQIYSASKLLKNEEALVGRQQKHSGPVHALDFNSFQQNLFATGAGESEIFIWDLNNTTTPMSPGAKSQPLEDVLSVAWNKQVQHILASSFASKCVIWDLRKNEPIIKLTDTVSRIRWKMVAWHPEVATQLCLASEEDHSPVIQVWDLRFATSPLKTLENHQRGVLAISWCDHDSDLLISCGKDDRILCWNPNSNQPNGEVLSEIAKTNQWSFDVAWCPRNPALIACPNYDGHVAVYSIMGGKTQQIQTTNKIADSFPGMDGFVQAPTQQQTHAIVSVDPTKPPKWLRKPVGASFGFGGKLITFETDKEALAQAQQNVQPGQLPPPVHRTVQISQVITEAEFVRKSAALEQALESGNYVDYCLNKSNETSDQHKKFVWHFLKANFEPNPRAEFLNLLGYKVEDVNTKLCQHIGKPLLKSKMDGLVDQFEGNRIEDYDDSGDPFDNISQQNGIDKSTVPFQIKTNDDTDGLITQALLLNNIEAAVELCLKADRYADALIIATTGGPDLLAKTQHQYLEKSKGYVSNLISALISEDWGSVINNCDIGNWKEALVAAVTHASEEDFPILCEQLGSRLESESYSNPKMAQDAQLCYICSGDFDKLVTSWSGNSITSTKDLQELVELISFLQKAMERQGKRVQISGALADLLSQYASLLAAQGSLQTALGYLGNSQNEKVASLRDRLLTALGQKPLNIQEIRQQQARRGSTRVSQSGYGGGSISGFNQNQYTAQPTPQIPAPQPPAPFATNNFNTGLPNASVGSQPWQTQAMPPSSGSQPWQTQPQPPKVFSPAPPPRPDSVGSGRGIAGPLSRKHVRDPSVTNSQFPPMNNPYTPAPYDNNSYNPGGAAFGQPAPQVYQPPPMSGSVGAMSPIPNPMLNPVPSVQQPPIETAQPAINYQAQAPPGWNDPPVVNRSVRQQPKPDLVASEPITHPIYGSAPVQTQPASNGYGYGDAPFQPPPMQPYGAPAPNTFNPPPSGGLPPSQSAYTPQTVPFVPSGGDQGFNPGLPPSGGFNTSHFNQNAIGGGQSQAIAPPMPKPAAPQPVHKPPVPSEHEIIQKIFDELKERCNCTSNNPQTKRKLEDVGRRLETLYDSLRYNSLSQNTLTSLHQIVQFVQAGDYASGLQLHTQLVQGPDFAQIASFMPGIKVLIQLALQLHVYLQ